MPVTMYEMDGFPKERWQDNKFSATRKLLVDWDERYQALAELTAGAGQLYPYLANAGIRCKDVAVERAPGKQDQVTPSSSGLATYEYAMLTAEYRVPSYGEPQPYPASVSPVLHNDPSAAISETLRPSTEALQMPADLFEWSDGTALLDDEAPVRQVHRMEYTLTRHNQTSVPAAAVSYVGNVNSESISPILYPDVVFPAHTLLFMPPNIDIASDSDGNVLFNVAYSFAYKEEGWRKFWRADTESYETIVKKSDDSNYAEPAEVAFSALYPSVA